MTTISVDVDLEDVFYEIDDQDLIDQLERRGYVVTEELDEELNLNKEEMDTLIDMVINAKPGTIEHSIYEKLRKR